LNVVTANTFGGVIMAITASCYFLLNVVPKIEGAVVVAAHYYLLFSFECCAEIMTPEQALHVLAYLAIFF